MFGSASRASGSAVTVTVPVCRPRGIEIFRSSLTVKILPRQRRQPADAARFDGLGDIGLADAGDRDGSAHRLPCRERRCGSAVRREVAIDQIVVEDVVDRTVAFVLYHASEHRTDLERHLLAHDERAQIVLIGDIDAAVVVILDIIVVTPPEQKSASRSGSAAILFFIMRCFLFPVGPSFVLHHLFHADHLRVGDRHP